MLFNYFSRSIKITEKQLIIFLRQLAALLSAGIVISRALEIIEVGHTVPSMRILLYKIRKDIYGGMQLSATLMKYPQHFDPFTSRLIQIGELTGKLEVLLDTLAAYKQYKIENISKLKQALFYPATALTFTFIIMSILLYFIVPKYAIFFADMQVHLPFYTGLLFQIADFFHDFIWLILLSSGLAIWYIGHKKILMKISYKVCDKIPIINQVVHKTMLANFAKVLAITLASGITMVDALKLVEQTYPEPKAFFIKRIKSKVITGISLHQSMTNSAFFPPFMIQMIKIGEEIGRLENMLHQTCQFYEYEIEQLHTYLIKAVEPLIMLLLGVLIGGLVIILYLPIFDLGSAL